MYAHNTNTPKINKAKDGDNKGGAGPCVEYTSQNHRGINKMLREVADRTNNDTGSINSWING